MVDIGIDIRDLAAVVGLTGGAISIYVTVRLTPLIRRIDKLATTISTVSKDREKEDDRLSQQIQGIHIPNCAAEKAQLEKTLADGIAQLRLEVLQRVMEISTANSEFRESIKDNLLNQTQTWSRETVSREKVEQMMQRLRDDVDRALDKLEERFS